MAKYNGSIELISGITQKNGGNFPLVDASAVQVDDTGKRLDVRLKELSEGNATNSNYNNLLNRPSIGGVTLTGNKTLSDLNVLDDTLTVAGKAADAKAVGDKITTLDGEVVKTVTVGGVTQTITGNALALPAYPTKESLGLDKVSNTADADRVVGKADKLTTARTIALGGDATGSTSFDGSQNVTINVTVADDSHKHSDASITSLDASKLTGTIDIARLPQGALERCVVVKDDTARFALTTDSVQVGDTVKVTDTGKMYFVVDDTKLNVEAGYEVYTAGSATSVPWSGVTDKPDTFTPSAHTHAIADVSGLQTALDAKALNSDLTAHKGDTTVHITSTERTNWNSAYTHSTSAHARVDATKTEKSTTNGSIKINGTDTVVYSHVKYTAKDSGMYKITVDAEGHVSAATAVAKADITALGIPGADTGVTSVEVANGLTQKIEGRKLSLGVSEISTDLLAQGTNTLIINGGRA